MFVGYISRQHTIWCGVCGNWDQIGSKRKTTAIRFWRKNGWKLLKETGWTCPGCVLASKEKADAHDSKVD